MRDVINIDDVLATLTLTDKCHLLAGVSTWRSKEFPDLGIPAIRMSDGPNGIRGEGHGGSGTPGVVVPSGITLGATWDPSLVEEIGSLLGSEARRKGAHVLLGPTVNLHRTPIGGRTFECYSEDPELTGALASAYVRGVQSHDVAVTVKHFVCNDTEIERMRVDVDIDERPLRELYLRPFERAVREANAWGIMSAYNKLGGDHCAHNQRLLTDILRTEWGFDGFVVSDWYGVHDATAAANAGLNLEMPGPVRIYGDKLVTSVEQGEVDEAQVDLLVRDLLVLINRVKADERDANAPEQSVDDPTERALTRRAAIAGTVLLRNEPAANSNPAMTGTQGTGPVLPLDPSMLSSVAIIGPNAALDRSIGGGSASLAPLGRRTFFDAITDRIGPETATGAHVTFEPGVRIDRLTPVATRSQLRQPNGQPGLRVSYVNGRDWNGEVVVEDTTSSSMVRFFGSTPKGVDPRGFAARIDGTFIPDSTGIHTFGVVSTGPVKVVATQGGPGQGGPGQGGPGQAESATTVVDDADMELPRSKEFFGYGSIEATHAIECTAGVPVTLDIRWATAAGNGFAALRLGIRSPEPADLLERAVAAAAAADVAIVVVGTNDEWETEGFDRTTMDLPGRQDELVQQVAAANPNTVVIVNAGSPVTMDWAEPADPAAGSAPAPAILTSFFAGQEQAEALVDVLLGDADPGGRLPITIPKRLADHPALLHHQPDHDGQGAAVQRYGEGLFIGYRAYDARSLQTRFPFGHGLSFGAADWGPATVSATEISTDGSVTATVPLTATTTRPVTVVVQGYISAIDPTCVRPPKELRSWQKVVIGPGEQTTVSLTFGPDSFHRWDTASNGWIVEPGEYDIVLAASAEDERERIRIRISESPPDRAATGTVGDELTG